MDLAPDLHIDDVTFREGRRGYDPGEVDDFLERVAEAVARLQAQLVDAVERAQSLEDRLESQPADDPATAPGAEEIQRALLLAQRTADAAIAEAQEEATRRTSEAEREAARIVGDADAQAAQHREEASGLLQREITELEASRDELANQVAILERHVDEQRVQLRSSINELQRLLEDPDGLRIEAPPVFTPPAAESGEDPDATVVTVVSEVPDPDETVVAEMPPSPAERSAPPADENDYSADAELAPPPGRTDEGEDTFLAELRQAMTDDDASGPHGDAGDGQPARARTRFGRRR